MGVVAGGAGVASAMRLLFVPLAGLLCVVVIALVRDGVVGRTLASVGARE
jgi:hypothetical protein